jgi:polysaccharide chain length determinant protein (PEP-CTERM system associated)
MNEMNEQIERNIIANRRKPLNLLKLLDLLIRKRWLVLLPFCLAIVVGTYMAITLPKQYEAKTLILIEPQRVPRSYVQSIVTEDPAERINTLTQQILSQTNLEKIIKDFGLFNDAKNKNLFMEQKIERLRQQITIDVISDRKRQTDAFSIAFRGRDPKKVARVANGLTTYFIDENLKVRETQALGTSDFLDAELESMRNKLEKVEERIKEYRKSNMGELPEQLETNLRVLDRMQASLNEQQQNLREARSRLAELKSQGTMQGQQAASQGAGPATGGSLLEMRAQLESLQRRYTDNHPDIVRLKKNIADLEAEQNAMAADGDTSPPQYATAHLPPQLRVQILDTQREIESTQGQIAAIQAQIVTYQKRVETTPNREQELLSLRRDYQNIQASYDSLLSRKLEADIAVNMERKQKGEQFRIVDPAKEPHIPVAPNMKKVFIFTLMAGLGLGGGMVLLMNKAKPTYHQPDEVENTYQVPVLTSIPTLYQPKQILLHKVEAALSIAFTVTTLAGLAVFAIVCIKGGGPAMETFRQLISR